MWRFSLKFNVTIWLGQGRGVLTVTIQPADLFWHFTENFRLRRSMLWQCLRWRRCGPWHGHGGWLYIHLHSVFLSFFLLLSLFLSDALALSRSSSFFLCLSFGVSFLYTHWDTFNPFLYGGIGTERYITKWGMRISRILLIKSTVSFDVRKTQIPMLL